MAVYMLITSAVIANLYTRYCDDLDDNGSECEDDVDGKFVVFPVFGFVIMVVWVSIIDHFYECDALQTQPTLNDSLSYYAHNTTT